MGFQAFQFVKREQFQQLSQLGEFCLGFEQ
jgi:hypothetical protein